MKIRIATVQDAAAIAALHAANWQQVYRDSLSAAYLREQVPQERLDLWQTRLHQPTENQRIWLAEQDGELCGFACAFGGQDAQWGTYIDNLHVASNWRGCGIGAQLLLEIAQWHHDGYIHAGIYLWCVESNTSSIGFYRRCAGQVQDLDFWHAPDGAALPSLRITWPSAQSLLAAYSPFVSCGSSV